MRIGLFGGSFDPPHRGHLAVALAAANEFALDRVMLVPAGRQPLKPAGSSASYADRLAMVQLLAAGEPRLEASAIEAPGEDHAQPNYTIDTVRRLKVSNPEDELFVITGVDAFADLPRWRSPEDLLRMVQWIVVSRPGQDMSAALQKVAVLGGSRRIHSLEGVHEDMSATAVRDCLARRGNCRGLLLPSIAAYIREHNLYSPTREEQQ